MKKLVFYSLPALWAVCGTGCGPVETVVGKPDYLGSDTPIFASVGDSLFYQLTTYVGTESSRLDPLNMHGVTLRYLGDSLYNGQTYAVIEIAGSVLATGVIEIRESVLARLGTGGVPDIQGLSEGLAGPGLLSGKVVFTEHSISSLVHVLLDRSVVTYDVGSFQFARELSESGTLEFQGRLEETWNVRENVEYGAQMLMRGLYWYGASGLLRGEMIWEGMEFRSWSGERRGPGEVTQIFELSPG